ncbi:MAG: NAD(P)/FAD-dependent oxidoreductase, partial [Alphaproteobacteria bacterium]
FQPSLLWLMLGQRRAEQISRPLSRLKRKGIEIVRGEIVAIDPQKRTALVNGETITADHMVIALGADLAPDSIPGLSQSGHNLYSLAGAQGLSRALAEFRSGRVVVLTAAPAYKCPAAPYEAAMLIADHLRQNGLAERTSVDLYAAEPGPMGVAGPDVSAGVRGLVESRGITYHPEHQVERIDPARRHIEFANGATAEFDLLVYIPPHQAPEVVRAAGLVGESGWIPVDRHTLETQYAGVYAIGDVVGIPLKMGKPLPKAGVFAHGEAEVVADNIVHAIKGGGKTRRFEGYGNCFIETGAGRAGYGAGDFYAEPTPQIALRAIGRRWHLGKVLFEKYWLWRWL